MSQDVLVDEQIEMALLGAMIRDESTAARCLAEIAPADFWAPRHKVIYKAMSEVAATGAAVDIATLRARLTATGKMADAAGIEYLMQLVEACPTESNAPHYLTIVRELSTRRRLREECRKLASDLGEFSMDDAELMTRLDKIRGGIKTGGVAGKHISEIDLSRPRKGLRVGFTPLDTNREMPGLPCGQVTMVSAVSGVGKSNLMLQFANSVAMGGGRALYVTVTDLDEQDCLQRMLKQRFEIKHESEARDAFHQEDFLKASKRFLEWENVHVYDSGAVKSPAGAHINTICGWIQAEIDRRHVHLVCLDYAQQVDGEGETRVQQTESVSRLYARLASHNKDTAFVIGSQVNNDGSSWYSKSLVQDCGFWLSLTVDEAQGVSKWLENRTIEIKKARFGWSGSIEVTFDRKYLVHHPRGESGPAQAAKVLL